MTRDTKQTYQAKLSGILQFKLANCIISTVMLAAGLIYQKLSPDQIQVSEIILALAALIIAIPVFINAGRGLMSRGGSYVSDQLVSLAILASMIQGNFVVAAILPIILSFGHLLEEKSIMGIDEAVSSLKRLHSNQARVLTGKQLEEQIMSPEDLKINDQVVCYPGEILAADGVVISGESLVNQAPITGESVPVEAFPGMNVFAGTINLSGKIVIKVSKQPRDTLLSKVVNLLKEAERSKAPIIKIVEKYLDLYFPLVITLAAITLFITNDVNRAIAVLVISCPCALILASPTAMIASLVVATRNGIMIKNTAFLESLAEVDTLIFDKTGTVTYGRLEVEEVMAAPNIKPEDLLARAAFCASGSIHPVSASIRDYVRERGIKHDNPTSQTELHGCGVISKQGNRKFYLGKKDWIESQINLEIPEPSVESDDSGASVYVAETRRYLGKIQFSDKPRSDVVEAVAECRQQQVKQVFLLTGDRAEVGNKIGSFLAADRTISQCLPQDKLNFVNQQKQLGYRVMFVGDGINDALALKASDVGVAIARGGSDIAIQNADIILNSESLLKLPLMIQLSARTRRIINQNIVIGTGYGLILLFLASVGIINPVVGALVHNLGSIFVIVNSARMLADHTVCPAHQPDDQAHCRL